jgi:hypothetical protein
VQVCTLTNRHIIGVARSQRSLPPPPTMPPPSVIICIDVTPAYDEAVGDTSPDRIYMESTPQYAATGSPELGPEPPRSDAATKVFDMSRWQRSVTRRHDLSGGTMTRKKFKRSIRLLRDGINAGPETPPSGHAPSGHAPSGHDFAKTLSGLIRNAKKDDWRRMRPKTLMLLLRAHIQNEAWYAEARREQRAKNQSPTWYSDSGGSMLDEISCTMITN